MSEETKVMSAIGSEIKELQRACKIGIDDLMVQLNSIKDRIINSKILNNLGELQGQCTILDCQIASLATLQRVEAKLRKN